ncbi:hypothetical protein SSPIM334S_00502 [Streptomyces spiroverticillatus]
MSLSRRGLLAAGGGTVGALAAGGAAQAAEAGHGSGGGPRVRTGFDRLAADGYRLLRGRKVGIVTNPTGVTSDVRHIVDVMHADARVNLTAVFGPEHGFRGTAQAGGSEGRYDDPATGLPVYDTYLKSGQPLADVFTASGVDTVVFDIQDAGARFYTYIWTLYDCMVAAALAGKRFVVLDRPSPVLIALALGGALFCMGVVYGPMGAYLPELFGARVRYSGASLAYNLGGVLGGAVAPLVATRLQAGFGSASVGWYVSAMAVVSLLCVLALPETRERELG